MRGVGCLSADVGFSTVERLYLCIRSQGIQGDVYCGEFRSYYYRIWPADGLLQALI